MNYQRSTSPRSLHKKWTTLGLTVILETCLTLPAAAQLLVIPPEQIAGPWELTRGSGVDGIFVMIYRQPSSTPPRESIQVRIHHRSRGSESREWYVVSRDPDSAGRFDGKTLHVPLLTVTFDPDAAHWTGEWLLGGERRTVVLERPQPPNSVTSNALCGNWQAVSDGAHLVSETDGSRSAAATSIFMHIVQSSDGNLTAWMDWVDAIVLEHVESATYGRSMKVISADPNDVTLQNESSNYSELGRFAGVLSDDGNVLRGSWNGSAPGTFRRIQ
jgi:hypothetical protein